MKKIISNAIAIKWRILDWTKVADMVSKYKNDLAWLLKISEKINPKTALSIVLIFWLLAWSGIYLYKRSDWSNQEVSQDVPQNWFKGKVSFDVKKSDWVWIWKISYVIGQNQDNSTSAKVTKLWLDINWVLKNISQIKTIFNKYENLKFNAWIPRENIDWAFDSLQRKLIKLKAVLDTINENILLSNYHYDKAEISKIELQINEIILASNQLFSKYWTLLESGKWHPVYVSNWLKEIQNLMKSLVAYNPNDDERSQLLLFYNYINSLLISIENTQNFEIDLLKIIWKLEEFLRFDVKSWWLSPLKENISWFVKWLQERSEKDKSIDSSWLISESLILNDKITKLIEYINIR